MTGLIRRFGFSAYVVGGTILGHTSQFYAYSQYAKRQNSGVSSLVGNPDLVYTRLVIPSLEKNGDALIVGFGIVWMWPYLIYDAYQTLQEVRTDRDKPAI